MKKTIFILGTILIFITGCAKTNPAYKGLQKSPCACNKVNVGKSNV